ncbi:EAL domain-containing protein [Deinococcus sp. Arct2-2]|uniref:EAL domain-containing protein n=1 Tax=Deinococcus sp. Arct2-2 TaxID=2568653 RepID=UPI0010A3E9DF|nr:EAL domain-containing protein [Deinococcus sp. Arct2-2]THF70272.1 EAL domain-containing protein [Deinococcus sp. Arct2-2]
MDIPLAFATNLAGLSGPVGLADDLLTTTVRGEPTPRELYRRVLALSVQAVPGVLTGRLFGREADGRFRLLAATGHALELLDALNLEARDLVYNSAHRSQWVSGFRAAFGDHLPTDQLAMLELAHQATSLYSTPDDPKNYAVQVLIVPVLVSGEVRGVLQLDRPDTQRTATEARQNASLLEADLTLGQWCGAQVALVMQHLDTAATLLAGHKELNLLNRAHAAVTGARDLEDLFQRIISTVTELLGVQHATIALLDGNVLVPQQHVGGGVWGLSYPVTLGVAGRVARTGMSTLLPDVHQDPEYVEEHPDVISELCVPLLDGERIVGVLNLESSTQRLTPQDLRQVQALGVWLGRAIERERLYAATEQQRRALDLLHRVRTAVSRPLDLPETIRAVNESIAQTLGYPQVSVYLRKGDELVLQHQLGYEQVIERLPIASGVMGRVARTGQAAWIEDIDQDPEALKAMEGISSEVCVPLCLYGKVVGVLNVESVGERRLRAWDAELITAAGEYVQYSLERASLHAEVKDREVLYRLLAENTSDLVCLHQPGGRLIYVSPSITPLLGFAPSDAVLNKPALLVHPEDRYYIRRAFRAGGEAIRWRLRHRDGRYIWFETTISRIEQVTDGPEAPPGQFLTSSRDITARQGAEARLAWAATHDPLTHLPNRALLFERLSSVLRAAQRSGNHAYAVLYLDMDRFKVINDSLGHAVGDELLVAFAHRLQSTMRQGDLVARLGGDEFAVLLLGTPESGTQDGGLMEAKRAAARLQAALTEPFAVAGHTLRVAVSVGIAPGRAGHTTPGDVLRDADLSMYRAKRDRRHTVATFDPSMHVRAVRQLQLEADLPHAARAGQLQLHFQPIVNLISGRLHSAEALVRWQHPQLGLIPPDEFIPLAEELDLIADLGDWVLHRACALYQSWNASQMSLNVNVSTRQFLKEGFVQRVEAALKVHAMPATHLNLEITESALVEDVDEAARTLAGLRALGVRVQIDDFGTGHSSLAFLHRFPVDVLKIDRAFIARLGEDAVSASVVKTVVLLAQALGAGVVAEGIETELHRSHLLHLGCPLGQGYLFSRPLLPGEFAAQWLGAAQADSSSPSPEA